MQFDYEITERDFLDGQPLAIKNHPNRTIRWMHTYFFVLGILGLGFFVQVVVTQGFSLRVLGALILPLLFISLPLLNTWGRIRMYRKSTTLHGRLNVDINENGWGSEGPSFSGKTDWSNYSRFFEDDKVFVIYQSTQIFNIISKRSLTSDQISELRQYFERNIGTAKSKS